MTDRSLTALAERFALPEPALERLTTLLDALLAPEAPTAIRDRERAVNDHLADSLVGLEAPGLREAREVADLGAGAGLPGLVLAIALPDARVTLIESAGRKSAFIARTAARCRLPNVAVESRRVEEVTPPQPGFDVVTARALASLAVVAEYAAPLLRPAGTLVAWRGQRDPQAEAEAEAAAEVLGLQAEKVIRVEPYPGARARHLHLMSKVRPTPPRFPRRAGMAVKRPLGT